MYDNTTPVIPEAFTLIQKFLANKKASDQVFDHVQPEVRTGTRLGRGAAPHARAQPRAAHLPRLRPLYKDLNEYFKSIMEGLSAKVFRTYNASITLCSELQKTAEQVTKAKIAKEGYVEAHCEWYHIANKNVAELCNHQKATSAAHQGQVNGRH